VTSTGTASHTSRFLLTATGFLSQPRLPDERASPEILAHMLERMDDTVFDLGCLLHLTQLLLHQRGRRGHLRPTSSGAARKAVERFPITAYEFA
jgi:hypothetical protein